MCVGKASQVVSLITRMELDKETGSIVSVAMNGDGFFGCFVG